MVWDFNFRDVVWQRCLTDCCDSDHFEHFWSWWTLICKCLNDILGKTEANDGQLGRLDDDRGDPTEN